MCKEKKCWSLMKLLCNTVFEQIMGSPLCLLFFPRRANTAPFYKKQQWGDVVVMWFCSLSLQDNKACA